MQQNYTLFSKAFQIQFTALFQTKTTSTHTIQATNT